MRQAEKLPPIAFPTVPLRDDQLPLFRHATGVCLRVAGQRAIAGENRAGEPGYVAHRRLRDRRRRPGHERRGRLVEEPERQGQLARRPGQRRSSCPTGESRMRLVAGERAAGPGAERSAVDSASRSPTTTAPMRCNGSRSPAIALVIYGLAVRKRLKEEPQAE